MAFCGIRINIEEQKGCCMANRMRSFSFPKILINFLEFTGITLLDKRFQTLLELFNRS